VRKRLVLVAGAVVFGGLVLAAPASACDGDAAVISPTPVPIELPLGDLGGGPRGGGLTPASGDATRLSGTSVPVEPLESPSGDSTTLGSPGSIGVPM